MSLVVVSTTFTKVGKRCNVITVLADLPTYSLKLGVHIHSYLSAKCFSCLHKVLRSQTVWVPIALGYGLLKSAS